MEKHIRTDVSLGIGVGWGEPAEIGWRRGGAAPRQQSLYLRCYYSRRVGAMRIVQPAWTAKKSS